MRHLLLTLLFLSGCSAASINSSELDSIKFEDNPDAAHQQMCIGEHYGILRHARAYLEEYCPTVKTQYELICFRTNRNTKDWRKACPGIDTIDKLECISVIQNGHGYALLDSLLKCKSVVNRKQIFCLSKIVAKAGVPLQPEVVQECLDKNL